MTGPIQITDEMRETIYTADCLAKGHLFTFNVLTTNDTPTGPRMDVSGGHEIANMACKRCGKVWLVIEEPGRDYQDAVAKLKARMIDPGSVKEPPKAPKP